MRQERGRPPGLSAKSDPGEQPRVKSSTKPLTHILHHPHHSRKPRTPFWTAASYRVSTAGASLVLFYFSWHVGRAAPHAPTLALAIAGGLFCWLLIACACAALWAFVFGGRS